MQGSKDADNNLRSKEYKMDAVLKTDNNCNFLFTLAPLGTMRRRSRNLQLLYILMGGL